MKKLKLNELGRLSVTEFKNTIKIPLVVILENVRSALNTGSVFRSCDAFAAEKIILTGITAQPPHKDILKSALGATDSVNWEYFSNTDEAIHKLRNEGYKIYAVEQTDSGILLPEFSPANGEKLALIFGNEVDGVRNETIALCDGCLELPQYGTKHSLNVAVCAGIFIYDLFAKMKA
ncbi:MAG: RNA methyltransferase [Bacteroidetes bacterium]|nr:RNA methyltransferase [Bacteroidota bacterium]